ncbi:MAG: GNAT family N-acetyltransferase [Deltaproteobacteria bacterium]|nr:GNAT family N-acetyltransferase [Deltaproteobacteria bacterium]
MPSHPPDTLRVKTGLSVEALAPSLAQMDHTVFQDPAWGESAYRGLLTGGGAEGWLLVTEGGEPAGFLVFRRAADEVELLRIAILPRFRRQGWGRWLVESFCGVMARQGAATVFLELRAQNRQAAGLYRSVGFVQAGLRPGYYSHPPEDALIFKKELTRKN